MTGIILSPHFGLQTSSHAIIGQHPGGGFSGLGQTGQGVYVNASTGNLVIQSMDDWMQSVGINTSVVRTYNSLLGADPDGANDGFAIGFHRKLLIETLSGTRNQAGSSIQYRGADGAVLTFTYDAALGYYVN